MKLSTKARYGMRAMVDLALHYEKGPILLKDIAKRQEVSMKYLDHIISTLRANGLIESAKTRHSGYVVSRAPCQIKTYEIIKAVEGSLALVDCVDDPKICHRADFCATLNLWKKLKKSMRDVLEGVTLEDLANEQREIIEQKTKGEMYYI
jgi:Rrf2 family protein